MFTQLLDTIKRFNMFEPGERVIVAVSGGPDSMVLLHSLKKLEMEFSLRIAVAHLDHNIRKNSSGDMDFVESEAKDMGFKFFGKTINWKKHSLKGSLEEVLRNLRYDFLFEASKKFKAKKIVLGHTLDDQAETVLMRILRGSGLFGLSAILPKRSLSDIVIVRPLIEITREDVLNYARSENIHFVIDETNLDEKFFRNKIRKSLLPFLKKDYNPNIKSVLSGFAMTVGADYDFLSRQADFHIKKILKRRRGILVLPCDQFKKIDVSLRRIMYRKLVALLNGNQGRLSYRHVDDLEAFIFTRPLMSEVHLPFGIVVSKEAKNILFFKR